MIIDKQLQFSDAQAVTTATATASDNVIDMQVASRDADVDLWLKIDVDTTVSSAGTANVTFALISDSAEGFGTLPVAAWTSAAIAKATLVAGYNVVTMRLPKGLKRYVKVQYTPDTTDLNAGKFNACLIECPDSNNL